MLSRAPLLLAGLVLLSALAVAPASAQEDGSSIERALGYLASKQRADGRWNLYTQGYVVEAVAAAGADPRDWPSPDASAYDALTPETCAHMTLPSDREDCIYKSVLRIVHAAGAAGYDARTLNGVDGVARIREGFVAGQFGQAVFINDDVWAVLALRAAGVPPDDTMVRAGVHAIWDARDGDGGWGERVLAPTTNVDMTGMALAALAAAGEDVRGDAAARRFLLAHWHTSGGFRSIPQGGPNCQSTVWAIHGLDLLGASTNDSALGYLLGLQREDGGFAIGASGGSDLFCTTEAMLVVAGERYPLPSYQKPEPDLRPRHAAENASLSVAGFTRVRWAFEGFAVEGPNATHRFSRAGSYPFTLTAETGSARGRLRGELLVESARPLVGTFPSNVTVLRPAPLILDLSGTSDPDGHIVAFEVDWGDGNLTGGATHAYAAPGDYPVSVRARDDAGVWSEPSRFTALVPNRAPQLAPLPERIVADRVFGTTFAVEARDPDGDALEGIGERALRSTELGARVVEVVVRDAFGAEARANVTVETINLPPRVAIVLPADPVAGEPLVLRANASDADGPIPALRWEIAGATYDGATARVTLDRGTHAIRLVATDADGAASVTDATLVVRAPDAPATGASPEIRALEATLAGGSLHVAFDATGDATLRWTSDVGSGERRGVESPALVALEGARWIEATLEVSREGAVATRGTGLLLAAAEAPTPHPASARVDAADAVVVQPLADSEPLLPAAFNPEPPAREATPAPWWLAAAGLASLAAMRRRRAASA